MVPEKTQVSKSARCVFLLLTVDHMQKWKMQEISNPFHRQNYLISKRFSNFDRTGSKSCPFFSFAYQNLAVLCVKRPWNWFRFSWKCWCCMRSTVYASYEGIFLPVLGVAYASNYILIHEGSRLPLPNRVPLLSTKVYSNLFYWKSREHWPPPQWGKSMIRVYLKYFGAVDLMLNLCNN